MKNVIIKKEQIKEMSKLFRVLSSPIRIGMLKLLSEKDYCACKFPDLLHISQPLSSRNLAVLKQAGLISSTPNGQFNIYHLENREVLDLIQKAKDLSNAML
jgi:DNA-binding transcriptional ArsR family regulator